MYARKSANSSRSGHCISFFLNQLILTKNHANRAHVSSSHFDSAPQAVFQNGRQYQYSFLSSSRMIKISV